MGIIANIIAAIGNVSATTGSQGCFIFFFDEPKMPKALLDK